MNYINALLAAGSFTCTSHAGEGTKRKSVSDAGSVSRDGCQSSTDVESRQSQLGSAGSCIDVGSCQLAQSVGDFSANTSVASQATGDLLMSSGCKQSTGAVEFAFRAHEGGDVESQVCVWRVDNCGLAVSHHDYLINVATVNRAQVVDTVGGGGNCFFDAVRLGVQQMGIIRTVSELRLAAAMELEINAELYRPLYSVEDISLGQGHQAATSEQFVRRTRDGCAWATSMTVASMAKSLNMVINVISTTSDSTGRLSAWVNSFSDGVTHADRCIIVGYNRETAHYVVFWNLVVLAKYPGVLDDQNVNTVGDHRRRTTSESEKSRRVCMVCGNGQGYLACVGAKGLSTIMEQLCSRRVEFDKRVAIDGKFYIHVSCRKKFSRKKTSAANTASAPCLSEVRDIDGLNCDFRARCQLDEAMIHNDVEPDDNNMDTLSFTSRLRSTAITAMQLDSEDLGVDPKFIVDYQCGNCLRCGTAANDIDVRQCTGRWTKRTIRVLNVSSAESTFQLCKDCRVYLQLGTKYVGRDLWKYGWPYAVARLLLLPRHKTIRDDLWQLLPSTLRDCWKLLAEKLGLDTSFADVFRDATADVVRYQKLTTSGVIGDFLTAMRDYSFLSVKCPAGCFAYVDECHSIPFKHFL